MRITFGRIQEFDLTEAVGSNIMRSIMENQYRKSAIQVKVWGEYACFSRPEFAGERVSYPVMTPTAARGILESVFWKPQFLWKVYSIDILRPISWYSIKRNELSKRQDFNTAKGWYKKGGVGAFNITENRDQRNSLILRDVAYVIHANVVTGSGALAAKYRDQFRRRVHNGKHFHSPYLGCREFIANVGEVDGTEVPIELNMEFGPVVSDIRLGSDGHLISVGFSTLKAINGRVDIIDRNMI